MASTVEDGKMLLAATCEVCAKHAHVGRKARARADKCNVIILWNFVQRENAFDLLAEPYAITSLKRNEAGRQLSRRNKCHIEF